MENLIPFIPITLILLLVFTFVSLSKKWENKDRMTLVHIIIVLSYLTPSIFFFTQDGLIPLLGWIILPSGLLIHLIINTVSIVHLNNMKNISE